MLGTPESVMQALYMHLSCQTLTATPDLTIMAAFNSGLVNILSAPKSTIDNTQYHVLVLR